jgi:formate dehydrogenase subunit delta
MDAAKLVKMANAIADFFESEPDRTAQLTGVGLHLERFWEPRMRKGLLALIDQGGEEAGRLKELVRDAVAQRRATWEAMLAARADQR